MSDWKFLNQHRYSQPVVGIPRIYCSTSEDGFNGMFRFVLDTKRVRVIASDGEGWQHVSVSLEDEPKKCPTWIMMCKIKDLFFEDEQCVMQFHPAKSEYVNMHEGCLHLWYPTNQSFPKPDSLMVGYK